MDKATLWPYDIGATLASRSSHQSQVLKLSTWRYQPSIVVGITLIL